MRSAPPACTGGHLHVLGRRIWVVVAALVAATALLVLTARVAADHYHGDTVWRNALASLGGTQRNGDFGYVFLPAGDAVLSGHSPYLNPDAFTEPSQGPYAYPPLLALLITPLSALPERTAGTFLPGAIFSVLLIFAVAGALLLFGVRDWRCYPVALLYPVTLEAIEYGAIGPILLLLIALAWRFRDQPWGAGGATGGAVVLKLFLWPLIFWLAATHRARSATFAVATAVTLALLSWSVIAFRGIGDYPRLLQKLVDFEAVNSYSAFAVFRMLGLSETAGRVLVLLAGTVLLVFAWRAGRAAGSTPLERDRRSLILAVAAALVMTPILWLHYLVLLLVPIALARPRLSALWFAPLALTFFEAADWYRGWPYGDGKALVSVTACVALVLAASFRRIGVAGHEREAAPSGAL